MLPVFLREIDKEAVQRNKPRIAIVYSVENWDVVERLVNELRYEFRDTYHISALNVKTSQSQSIHEVPHHIRRHYSRCQVVYAIGVVYKSSPHFEPRLMDSLSRRLGALDNLPRLFVPVIDCILVRESKEQIEEDMQKCRFAEEWAKRMCRFLLYKSNSPILLADLLTRPAHSIIMQSFNCKLRVDLRRPMNGDGFGIGWYDDEPQTPGCIFTSTLPAWSNLNLQRLAEKIKSALVFAHVRATTGETATSESNCHPWQFGNLMWMHNGNIGGFESIKRRLQNALSEEIYLTIQGTTDSEHAFALFLNMLQEGGSLKRTEFSYQELRRAMLATIAQLNVWLDEAGVEETSLMNFAVTDGQSVVCTRYITSYDMEGASLYYSSGSEFRSEADSGQYRMIKANKREDVVVVASEPLTYERSDWMVIPTNTLLVITPKLNVHLYPIHDKYWNPHRQRTVPR